MSKRIMNEVICLAQDSQMKIYYQDTDSMHIADRHIPRLAENFRNKYNRELIGKGLGQFHSDFDLKGAVTDIMATESFFIGKKAYIDKLESEDKDGNIITGHHTRLKGITTGAIHKKCEDFNEDPMQLYKHMYDGNVVAFDLLAGRPKFEMCRDMSINSKKEFIRKVKFDLPEGTH
jgi:hypothetical protein